ncbi:MAG: hypothetical protein IH898_05320 [Planctomycetes bacterium]|nr:hypothetical protein [Planctomycetota bacterium]
MKSVLLVACALLLPMAPLASANEGDGGVYQRQRMQGGRQDYHGGNFYGHPYYGGYYTGYYSLHPVYGSWYARPYPTHLDYFRLRSRTPPMTPPVDCPCAEGPEPDLKQL